VRDPGSVLAQAAQTLDFAEPVAVMMLAILQLIPDDANPHAIVERLVDGLAAGSYLVISHPASDVLPGAMAEMQRRLTTFRPRPDICRFFDGLDLIEPGVVQPHRWRPGPGDLSPDQEVTAWCGVARKS
jgi:hypothetical protein